MSNQILLPSEIASLRSAKFPRGEKMTLDEVAEVVGPEFKEMNENPPPEVVKVMEEMQKQGSNGMGPGATRDPSDTSSLSPLQKKILDAFGEFREPANRNQLMPVLRLPPSQEKSVDTALRALVLRRELVEEGHGFRRLAGGRSGGSELLPSERFALETQTAKFHEGPKGEKEFQAWMKKQPKETQEDWAKYTEENKDKFKTAYLDPAQGEAAKHFLSHILGALRAQYLMYQTAHWQTKGPAYYGNHLLFQRLYGSVQVEIDAVAEKLVGYTGIDSVNLPVQIELIEKYCSRWCQIENLHERGLQSEKDMQKLFKATYENLKAQGSLPLGLDDWLMATASAHETNTYLLQQVLA